MPIIHAEFEEGEYRAPLFGQLASGSHLVWEPGQVFEQHIGIDQALWSEHPALMKLYGLTSPPPGATLSRYHWDYIWANRAKRKRLPTFELNLFIQAKRPVFNSRTPKALRNLGLLKSFWRFELTPHQQVALEVLTAKIKSKAIVCYACPVFHKQATLYKWTTEPKMVEHSTFPDASDLKGHAAWNFSVPGMFGVANAEPVRIEAPPLMTRVAALIERSPVDQLPPRATIEKLATAAKEVMQESFEQDSFTGARFAEGVREIEYFFGDRRLPDGYLEDREATVAYCTVRLFAALNRLNWLVIGEEQ